MKTKKIFFLFMGMFLLQGISFAQAPLAKKAVYSYTVDLTKVKNDRITVELAAPVFLKDSIIFRFPRMVPGIYGVLNFGKNIENIYAVDDKNKKIFLEKIDTNSWRMNRVAGVKKIVYEVNDDYEDFSTYQRLSYRSPRSTFEAGKLFLLNNNSVFGYFQDYDRIPLITTFIKPASLYASTSLDKTEETAKEVRFYAPDYHYLVDNPILFSIPDTTHIKIDHVNIMVSVYSTSGEKVSPAIANEIEPLLKNQKIYMGGKLPVDKYTFIIYHHASFDSTSSFGDGLEHAQSTVILLNMLMDKRMLSLNVYGIASHEFFHTLLPLALHSEEIANYDFNNPVMSRHLWLYEGMTEYFTLHMPIKQQLIGIDQFMESVERKIADMSMYEMKLSLTDLSQQAISRQDQYMNVYARGAMVSLCMDIRLRELSSGQFGVQELIQALMKMYGKQAPFKDDQLFENIASLSGYPEMKDFTEKYISGHEAPPMKEYLAKVGLILAPNGNVMLDKKAGEQQLALRKAWIGQ